MENRPMRISAVLVLLWMSVDGFAGAESASPVAEPAMLGRAAGYDPVICIDSSWG